MGGDLVAHTKPADLDMSYEDLPDAPLLPRDPQGAGDFAETKPPVTLKVARQDTNADSKAGARQNKNGFQTDLCDCCAQPGGVELCTNFEL